MTKKTISTKLWCSASLLGLMMSGFAVATPALAQEATAEENDSDLIVVQGFRKTLEQSRDLKRDAVNNRESIVAEDIGKLPDLNLAEAIQRVPGVTIERQGGEGRKVSVRGLGPEFTRVTLNGMEVPASTGGTDASGGVNRGRSFDFNVFAAELFNRIDIQKSPTASVEEGGVAGTVELYSARPLDRKGYNATLGVQAGYNDLSEATDPRILALISNTFADDRIGVLFSANYTQRTIYQDGFGTVRWAVPDRDFADISTATVNGQPATSAIQDLWYPRLPRQDSFRQDQTRLGLTGAVQFEPRDGTKFGANWLYSKFDSDLDGYNSFFQFRRSGAFGYPTITPVSVTTDSANRIAVAGTFDNVGLRTENRQQLESTEFNQITAEFEHELSDTMTLTGMIGRATSEFEQDYFRVNIETPVGGRFTYDFTGNSDVASLAFSQDVTDPANFNILTNDRIEQVFVDRTNDTARVDLNWALGNGELKLGVIANDREVDSRIDPGININDTPGNLAGISQVFSYTDAGDYGDATLLDFLVLNYDQARSAFNVGEYATRFGPGQPTWTVREQTVGAYAEYTHRFDALTVNVGGRVVITETEATGYADSSGDVVIEAQNDYTEFLPALNLVYDINEELLVRFGASRTLTRAGLSSLAPNQSFSDVNFTVSGGNPDLLPQFSNNLDASIEYYFGDTGLLSFAVFHKDIDDLIDSQQFSRGLTASELNVVQSLFPTQPELLDPSEIWDFSVSGNTASATLSGFEVAYQQDFDFLPGPLANTGLLANYTYVDGETEDADGNTAPVNGLSEYAWNMTVYYEEPDGRYGARVSVNSRDDFITRIPGSNGNAAEATTGPTQVDFASFYNLTENVTATFEIINLNDSEQRLFTTGDGDLDLIREITQTGRQFFIGLRADF